MNGAGPPRLSILSPFEPARLARVRAAGFARIQLRLGPGFPIDVGDDTLAGARDAARALAAEGLEVVALGFYRNMLDPDAAIRRAEARRLRNVLRLAAEVFRAPVVGVFAGRNPALAIEDNIPAFAEAWEPLARFAGDLGVGIAFENCSMFRGYPLAGINLSHTPAAYRAMFAALPSPAVGIEFDPSHCIKQRIAPLRFVAEFGPRILHVHAKDHERLPDGEYDHGCFDPRASRDRLPGRGEVDWRALLRALEGVGYRGAITLEAERDPDCPDEASLADGWRAAREVLENAIRHA